MFVDLPLFWMLGALNWGAANIKLYNSDQDLALLKHPAFD